MKEKIRHCHCGCRQETSTWYIPGHGTQKNRTHGHNCAHSKKRSRTYVVWMLMKQRCQNPRSTSYPRYGAKGIGVCDRWQSFEGFYEDMGERPSGTTLDRINPLGNYEPSNCRWATWVEQARNRINLHWIEIKGERKCLAEWTEVYGLDYKAAHHLLSKGLTFEQVIARLS